MGTAATSRELLRYSDIERPDHIPDGKAFRILFDAATGMMRVVCREPKVLEYMRDAFSDENQSAFYM